MKKPIKALLFLVWVSLALNVEAQQDDTWSLQRCIDFAIKNNIELKQDALAIQQSQANVEQGRGNIGPTLNFSTGHNVNWRPWSKSTVNLSGGTLTTTQNDVSYHGSYSLSANWTVWDGGRKYRNLENYKLAAEIAENDYQQTANSIEEQITQFYVQVLYQAEAVRVADSTLAISILQRDRAAQMVEAGSLARVDLAQLEAQAQQDQYSTVSTRSQLASYRLQLRQILELDPSTSFDVEDPSTADDVVLSPIPSIDETYDRALSSRPEFKNCQLALQQAEIQERIARSGRYPSISLSAGMSTSHSSASDDPLGSQIKQNVNNSLGLNISVPILDNRSTKVNKSKALIQKHQSELSLANQQKMVRKQVETYWLQASSAQAQYLAARSSVLSARESYGLVSEQFRLGLKNIVELTTGKNNLLKAEQQLLQAKYTALLNIALLRFYAGEPISL